MNSACAKVAPRSDLMLGIATKTMKLSSVATKTAVSSTANPIQRRGLRSAPAIVGTIETVSSTIDFSTLTGRITSAELDREVVEALLQIRAHLELDRRQGRVQLIGAA